MRMQGFRSDKSVANGKHLSTCRFANLDESPPSARRTWNPSNVTPCYHMHSSNLVVSFLGLNTGRAHPFSPILSPQSCSTVTSHLASNFIPPLAFSLLVHVSLKFKYPQCHARRALKMGPIAATRCYQAEEHKSE